MLRSTKVSAYFCRQSALLWDEGFGWKAIEYFYNTEMIESENISYFSQ